MQRKRSLRLAALVTLLLAGVILLAGGPTLAAMTWEAVKTPYAGSLWAGLQLANGTVLLGGMRGNLVKSLDDGRSWQHQAVADAGSITGVAVAANGRPVLVGVDGTVLVGDAAASRFTLQRLDDRATLTGVVAVGSGWVASSVGGMRTLELKP